MIVSPDRHEIPKSLPEGDVVSFLLYGIIYSYHFYGIIILQHC